MTAGSQTEHFDDEIQLLLDGRLEQPLRAQVEAHLSRCGRCQRELDLLRQVQRACRDQLTAFSVPAQLDSELRAALESAGPGDNWWLGWLPMPRRKLLFALAGLALLAVVSLFTYSRRRLPDLPHAAVDSFTAYQTGQQRLAMKTADGGRLEQYFAQQGIEFPTRVFDLAMMNYQLEGGRVDRLAGRRSALFVYRGPGGRSLLCQMYPGQVSELPAGAARSVHHGIEFYRYKIGHTTAVFWQEEAVTCVLVSDGKPEEVLQLAIAKAVKA